VLCRILGVSNVPTQEGFLYLAFILDAHSRKIVGWSIASLMKTELVVDALQMAVWRRKPSAGLVHHSDLGLQYTANSFGKRLEDVGIVPSMGRAGTALDNAMAESFVATLTSTRDRGNSTCALTLLITILLIGRTIVLIVKVALLS
jgi:putative transposase